MLSPVYPKEVLPEPYVAPSGSNPLKGVNNKRLLPDAETPKEESGVLLSNDLEKV